MAAKAFTYGKLPSQRSIRLFRLLIGLDSEEIRCTIDTYSLDDCPDYDTISLDWESSDYRDTVVLNKRRATVPMAIISALRCFRRSVELCTIRFWTECICVNQADDHERAQQLSLMRDIVSRAENVHVWLGDEKPERAAEIWHSIATSLTIFKAMHDDSGPYEDKLDFQKDFREKSVARAHEGRQHLLMYDCSDLNELCSKPWFRRTQSIHETCWAHLVYFQFGNETIGWAALSELVDYVRTAYPGYPRISTEHVQNPDYNALVSMALLNQSRLQLEQRLSSRDHLHYFRLAMWPSSAGLICRDPRDYLFSLIGIMKEVGTGTPPPSPDYSKSWPEAFTDFAVWALSKETDLLTLSMPTEPSSHLPSWVPNIVKCDYHGTLAEPTTPNFSAGKEGSPQIRISPDKKLLTLQARLVDKVRKSCQALNLEVSTSDEEFMDFDEPALAKFAARVTKVNRCLEERMSLASEGHEMKNGIFGMSQDRFDQFWKTIALEYLAETSVDPRGDDHYRQRFLDYMHVSRVLGEGRSAELYKAAFESVEDGNGKKMDLTDQAISYPLSLRFGITMGDRLALLPTRVEPGDEICVIPGAQVPHVIRRMPNKRFRLVGECYLYGFMRGEAMAMPQSDLVKIELE